MSASPEIDTSARRALERALRSSVAGEVRFDAGSRALYATDSSNYRQVPLGVVIPRNAADVAATHAACREHGAPIVNRGGGTSLAGQSCNTAVVIDMSKYLNRIVEIDAKRRTARVQPGVVLDDLRAATAPYGLTFGPDPSTHNRCTLGGMIGNNSCGVHSVQSRRTADNVHSLQVLTYDGSLMNVGETSDRELAAIVAAGDRRARIYARLRALRDEYAERVRERFPDIPRRVSGYNLGELLPERGFHVARALVGSESTCVTVLEATVGLVDDPKDRALLVLGYPDVFEAASHVPEILESEPIGLEGMDSYLLENMRRRKLFAEERQALPEGNAWLVVEVAGNAARDARDAAESLRARLEAKPDSPYVRVLLDAAEQQKIWRLRESALGVTAREHGRNTTWEGWEDSAVPPAKLDEYLRALRELLRRHGYRGSLYGHFGDGCVHTRIDFDLKSAAGIAKYRAFIDEAADLVVSFGGSLSGEHGDGQSRAALLPKMFGRDLVEAFRRFKRSWDPDGKMNPGKVVDPFPPTANLRLGADYSPPRVATHFAYRSDDGSFANAALRCVGVGACRKQHGGTMCPSYMATLEEEHSTRGRARLLFEMLEGDPIRDLWRSDAVKESLDLCLGCKACKAECPVRVDMATYKAEFLAHHYETAWRSRRAYFVGHIDRWSRLASRIPRLANFALQTPGVRALAAMAVGTSPARAFPRFAREPFDREFRRRAKVGGGRRVVLWPDTFNNHFYPATARAAVAVLEASGAAPVLPKTTICCGRPLYDFGYLAEARQRLLSVINMMQDEIKVKTPVVFLEPSCLSVFRDELKNLLPDDERASALAAQSVDLAAYLEACEGAPSWRPLARQALYHGHCHHKALLGTAPSERLLARAGVEATVLDAGCCGMAGSFGFEHVEVSRRIGERVLLPAVRAAEPDRLIVAEGFSCREQIRQMTGRRALHLADVLAEAVKPRDAGA